MNQPACRFEQETTAIRSRSTGAPAAGAVRVRPTGEVCPWQRNRYQYVVAGDSPAASTFTVWSRDGPVRSTPDAAIAPNPGSVATSQVTGTVGPRPEPGVACAVGVTRVQRTTAPGSGSPEATPCAKTVGAAPAGPAADTAATPTRAVPVVAAPSCRRERRLRGSITVCLLTETAGGCARAPPFTGRSAGGRRPVQGSLRRRADAIEP